MEQIELDHKTLVDLHALNAAAGEPGTDGQLAHLENFFESRDILYGAKILSIVRNWGWRLPEIIVDDTSQNILPSNQTFCTPLRARHRKVLVDALVRA